MRRFLAETLGRDAHRTRIDPAEARALFGWPQLNKALAEHRLTPPRLRLERAGADATKGVFKSRRTRRGAVLLDLDPAALTERLRNEATLILDSANELSAPLQALCSGLSAEFAASCQANLYACWGATQGFDVHWDDHDVFVVQVEGRKRWFLFGMTEPAPTRRGAAPPAARPAEPHEEIVLEPGDVLYLPRGYWHAAVGVGGPTLHLTIGLTRRCGSDFLHWLADEALGDEIVRADLPFEAGDGALGARIATLLADLAARDPQALGRAYRRHVEAGLRQPARLSFPLIGADEEAIAADDVLRLAEGAARLRRGENDDVVLSWRGTEFTLAAVLEPPLRRLLFGDAVPFAAFCEAAAGASRSEAEGLVREFLRRGVLVREPEADR